MVDILTDEDDGRTFSMRGDVSSLFAKISHRRFVRKHSSGASHLQNAFVRATAKVFSTLLGDQ